MNFKDLNLHHETLLGLSDMGFESPTPIQAQAIPLIMEGNDLIACAQTGTGKTAAFLIPTIDILDGYEERDIKCLVLCPTRELAIQIDRECEGLTFHTKVTSKAVFGGNKGGDDFNRQKQALAQGADIIISTPGRLLQHLSLGYVDLSKLEFLILDEADRMLDMGFQADIQRIMSYVPEDCQRLLFSATMPPKIRQLAKEILYKPQEISLKVSKPAEGITQEVYCVHDDQKIKLISHIFKTTPIENVIVFASRKTSVDKISKTLKELGFNVRGIHSDREQIEREQILDDFKNKEFPYLVATDILSRGIDIEGLSHVINFDVPKDPEDYVHRIGRTARADKKGVAITFVNTDDMHSFSRIERLIERELEKLPLPEHIGKGPEYKIERRSSGGFRGKRKFQGGKKNHGHSGKKGKSSSKNKPQN